ncbi:MAG: carbohydrate ABC transporter permease [Spirochaetes bacterium]|nr:carbohydrate ABC transporter permease [Spirochaetota bacterium]
MIVEKRSIVEKLLFILLALAFVVIFGFPFVITAMMSLKSLADYMSGNFWGFPQPIYFGNLQRVLFSDFNLFFLNSLFITGTSVIITVLAASLASYAFAKLKFRISPLLFTLFIIGMMIPIHATLIPVYQLTDALGLLDRRVGLIGPYVSRGLPVGIFIMTSFFREVPNSIQESAHVDGASAVRIYWSIMLPISTPAISTVAILNFLSYWNEFIIAMTIINSANRQTVPMGIRHFHGAEAINIPAVFAAILIASLPVMIFYMFAQERVINGLSAGAIKG